MTKEQFMTKNQFDALCMEQFTLALDKIKKNAPKDYATIGRDEFTKVAYRVFSQGVYMGYNLGLTYAQIEVIKDQQKRIAKGPIVQ